MRFLDARAVERLLDPQTAYNSQLEAFHCLGSGIADLAERLILNGTDGDALAFCYAARLRPGTPAVCKFGAVAPDNRRLGMPSVHAQILALHHRTGQLIAAFDGEAVTSLRTPAATAVAVDQLAVPGAGTLTVLGCGVQGRAHVHALAGRVSRVLLWDHRPGRAAELADQLATEVSAPVSAAPSAAAAVGAAELVVTCTTSSGPVLRGEWVNEGATVVSVGSFAPDRSEVDRTLVRRAGAVVVDHVPTALRQAGPIVSAVADGELAPEALIGLGDVVASGRPARSDAHTIVYYNSVGLGIQDAAAVSAMLAADTWQEQVP